MRIREAQARLSLIKRGVRVLTAAGDDLTATDDPFKKAMRQIAGAFAELEKARLVAKLRHARERIRNERGKCEGRKTRIERAERADNPELRAREGPHAGHGDGKAPPPGIAQDRRAQIAA